MNRRSWLGFAALTCGLGAASLLASTADVSSANAAPSGCTDRDGDGYGLGCAAGNDCSDRDPAMHPGAAETCNFKDDDCDGTVDNVSGCAAPAMDGSPVHVPAGAFLMGSDKGAAD